MYPRKQRPGASTARDPRRHISGLHLRHGLAEPNRAGHNEVCPGKTVKPIEAIEVGDLVWAWAEDENALVKRRVNRLFRHRNKPVLDVLCIADDESQQTITATTEHPFWIEGNGWVAAGDLQAGDMLKCIDGRGHTMSVLRVTDTGQTVDVFNFEVDGVHNYFVGSAGVLMHNMSNQNGSADSPRPVRQYYSRNDPLASQHDVALAAIDEYMPISVERNTEFGGLVVRRPDGSHYSTRPTVGQEKSIGILDHRLGSKPEAPEVPPGHVVVAWWHTHGRGIDPGYFVLSDSDANVGSRNGIGTYMGDPGGKVKYLKAGGDYNQFVAKRLGLAVWGDVEVVGRVRTKASDAEIFIAASDDPRRSSNRGPYPGAFEAFAPYQLPVPVDLRKLDIPEPAQTGWGPDPFGRYQVGIFPRRPK